MKGLTRRTWLVLLAVVAILATLVPTSFAMTPSPGTLADDEAIVMLQTYGIVKGDENGNLKLEQNITRAEAAAIFVRAMGASDLGKMLQDIIEFQDTNGHWANGEITMAKRLGLMQGANGYFRPNDNITYAELMTVMLRMVQREPAGAWNAQGIMQAAANAGIAPASTDLGLLANLPAQRGKVFKSLAITISAIPLPTGETLLAKHLDHTAPQLTVSTLPATSTSDSIVVSGTATDAWKVLVNGQAAAMTGASFSATVKLTPGSNNILVEAYDYAGNKASKTFTVSTGGNPARIDVTGPTAVPAGGTATIRATAYDANNVALPASAVTAQVTGNIGTYNAATGQFLAGSTIGTGSITFIAGTVTKVYNIAVTGLAQSAQALRIRPVNDGNLLTLNRFAKVEVEVVDADGNALPYDGGRNITLTASPDGLNVAESVVATAAGVATFTVTPVKEGDYTLTATAPGLDSDSTDATVGTDIRVVLAATPTTMNANGSDIATIRATLQNADGQTVTNRSDTDIAVSLSVTGADGQLTDSYLVISRNVSTSAGFDGHFVAGLKGGTAKISGTITSDHKYAVQATNITLNQAAVGTASKFDLVGGGGTKLPNQEITLGVRVTDSSGNPISNGSYAFQLQVTTSNTRDSIVNGLPAGVTLDMAGLSPAYNGGTTSVVGRTVDGAATFKLNYTKSGIVTVKVVGVSSTKVAFDDEGNPDAASSSTSFSSVTRTFTYDDITGGTKGIELVWDLPALNLKEQPAAVMSANGSTSAKLRAYLVDQAGGRRPSGGGKMTLTKSGAGTRGDKEAIVKNGVAEFSIASTTVADLDSFTVTYSGAGVAPGITVAQTETAKVDKPAIWSAYGESGNPKRVEISDNYLEILVSPVADTYGVVKVYSVGSGRLIYTSNVMDLSGSPSVRVPKTALPNGADRYKIAINNGYGDSTMSDAYPNTSDVSEMIVNAKPVKIDITAVRYDAETGKLTVSASGVSSSYGGTIQADKLSLKKGSLEIPLSGADCTVGSGSFTCDLSSFGLTATSNNGAWLLNTADGWYTRTTNGDSAAADENTENNYITPFANITAVAVDFATGKVTLYGVNLNTGAINLSSLWFNDPTTTLGTGTVRPTSSTEYSFIASATVAAKLRALTGGGNVLHGERGWLKDSYSNENAELDTPAPILAAVNVGYVSYNASSGVLTINGKGLAGGTVDLTKLVIKNRKSVVLLRLGAGDSILNLDTDDKLTSDKVEIKLGTTSKTALEATGNRGNVYLSSDDTDPAKSNGWFTDAQGRYGTTIRSLTYLLNW